MSTKKTATLTKKIASLSTIPTDPNEIKAAYKAWRKVFNQRWDELREKQRKEAAAYKAQFDAWQAELDKYLADRDAALAKAGEQVEA